MTTSPGSIFDDMARLMTGAMGVAQGVGEEARSFVRSQADRFIAEMDLVTREEYDSLKRETEALRARLEALEAALSEKD